MNKQRKMLFNIRNISVLLIAFCIASCDDESSENKIKEEDRAEIEAYLEENNINATEHSSGIYYEELSSNASGQQVTDGSILNVKYTFSVLGGDTLDINEDTTVLFGHGYQYSVPYGFDIGVGLMKNGERFRFYIPSWLAFGEYESQDYNLPYNAILVCEAEILDLHTEYEQKTSEIDSISKYIEENNLEGVQNYPDELYFLLTEENVNGISPGYGDMVTIHFTRKYLNGEVHFSTHDQDGPVQFRIGSNSAVQGLEEGIKLMRGGEEAILILPSDIGFGASNQVLPIELRNELIDEGMIHDYPAPFSPIIYEVELLNVN